MPGQRTLKAFDAIRLERWRQFNKLTDSKIPWDCANPETPREWATLVLVEEVGEVCRAQLENKSDDYEKELVQVAAVAVAILESFYAGQDNERKSNDTTREAHSKVRRKVRRV